MARTTHERGAEALYAGLMQKVGWRELITSWQVRIATGEARYDDFAMYGQPWRGDWPAYQLAAAVFLHTQVVHGKIGWQNYPVPHGPARDRCRAENAETLHGLHDELVVEVDQDQNLGDCDGSITWSTPLPIWRSTGEVDADGEIVAESTTFDRFANGWTAPLEIGSTMASRTLDHLMSTGAVARWPYGSTQVQVLVNLGKLRSEEMAELIEG